MPNFSGIINPYLTAPKGAFIYGPKATFNENEIKIKLYDYEKKKFLTLFTDIFSYSKIMLFKSNISDKALFINVLMETAIQINCKESTKDWIQELLIELNWK